MHSKLSEFDAAAIDLLGEEGFARVANGMTHQSAMCQEVAMKLLAGEIEEPNEALETVRKVARWQWLALQELRHQDETGAHPVRTG
jgi:spore germination cell wall hydrolase CwlJ-like protein